MHDRTHLCRAGTARYAGRIAAAVVLSVFAGCTGSREFINRPGTHCFVTDIPAPGGDRRFRYHVPPGGPEAMRGRPLLVAVHGAFETASSMEKTSRFSELADREQFVAAYPEGIGIAGLLQHWNAGHCCGKAAEEGVDDVGFILKVIDLLTEQYALDRERIFLVGFSNGGMLAHRMAAEQARRFAGFACVAGTHGGRRDASRPPEWTMPSPAQPVPALLIHGLSDAAVPYEGGAHKGKKQNGRRYRPVREGAVLWAQYNRCAPDSQTTRLDGGRVVREAWAPHGDPGAPVVLYTLRNHGHEWPGPERMKTLEDNPSRQHLGAAEVIWTFFSSQPRNRSARLQER